VVKCSEVVQYIIGLSNKVSNNIRRHTDNMNMLLTCIILLIYSSLFPMFQF